jgi:uncharacterized membrane protein YcgQ (UPF0703/DUF1980 family)
MQKYLKLLVLLILLTVLVVLISAASRRTKPTNSARLNSNYYTQLDIYDTLFGKSQPKKIKLLGSAKVTLEGKILKSKFLKADEIVVYRIVITCCVADGVPLGIVVKTPPDFADTLRDQDWVNLEGALKLLPVNQLNQRLFSSDLFANMVLPDQSFPYFVATKAVKQARTPGDEYLYP